MTKEEKKIVENYYRQYNIDLRTMGMIVYHYIDCGEREMSKLTIKTIDDATLQQYDEQKAAEAEGKICLITPEFVRYLLTACMGLYKLPDGIRYKLIKEWL